MLEAIRYIFDLPLQTDKEYKESLIKNIFGSGGKATLSVVDKHGKHYIVSRIYGEQSNVIDENGLDLNIQPSSLFEFNILGKKIYQIVLIMKMVFLRNWLVEK